MSAGIGQKIIESSSGGTGLEQSASGCSDGCGDSELTPGGAGGRRVSGNPIQKRSVEVSAPTELNDTAIRAVVKPLHPPGEVLRSKASLSAHALEHDRQASYEAWLKQRRADDGFRLDRPWQEPLP